MLEQDVQLIGLCLFRNELKHDTPEALELLREGGCRLVMITGDNADTAVFVAKRSGMIRGSLHGEPIVVMGNIFEESTLEQHDSEQQKKSVQEVLWKNTETQRLVTVNELNVMLEASRAGHGRPVELAITGKVFNLLLANGIMRDLLFGMYFIKIKRIESTDVIEFRYSRFCADDT